MKLRFIEIYDRDGRDVESGLQVWDEEAEQWEYVNTIRIPLKEKDVSMRDKNYV